MNFNDLAESLPIERRLALSYAPSAARRACAAMLGFDAMLGHLIRSSREPLLGQLRLAWWREELAKPVETRAKGEPLLGALEDLGDHAGGLVGLIDAWEGLLGEGAIAGPAFSALAEARGEAWAMVAQAVGCGSAGQNARTAGYEWALADLGCHLSNPDERAGVMGLIGDCRWLPADVPRDLRPLKVLHGLARRSRGSRPLLGRRRDLLAAFRLGLLGF